MTASPYKVLVVVDAEFGSRLAELPPDHPVWIVDTPANRAAAQQRWAERRNDTHLTGVTVFNTAAECSPEDNLLAQLGTIDLHHGSYSADPPYTILEVIGTPLSERIRSELSQCGFDDFCSSDVGFRALRGLP
jgi:hypothetical protein